MRAPAYSSKSVRRKRCRDLPRKCWASAATWFRCSPIIPSSTTWWRSTRRCADCMPRGSAARRPRMQSNSRRSQRRWQATFPQPAGQGGSSGSSSGAKSCAGGRGSADAWRGTYSSIKWRPLFRTRSFLRRRSGTRLGHLSRTESSGCQRAGGDHRRGDGPAGYRTHLR